MVLAVLRLAVEYGIDELIHRLAPILHVIEINRLLSLYLGLAIFSNDRREISERAIIGLHDINAVTPERSISDDIGKDASESMLEINAHLQAGDLSIEIDLCLGADGGLGNAERTQGQEILFIFHYKPAFSDTEIGAGDSEA